MSAIPLQVTAEIRLICEAIMGTPDEYAKTRPLLEALLPNIPEARNLLIQLDEAAKAADRNEKVFRALPDGCVGNYLTWRAYRMTMNEVIYGDVMGCDS